MKLKRAASPIVAATRATLRWLWTHPTGSVSAVIVHDMATVDAHLDPLFTVTRVRYIVRAIKEHLAHKIPWTDPAANQKVLGPHGEWLSASKVGTVRRTAWIAGFEAELARRGVDPWATIESKRCNHPLTNKPS